MSTDLLASQRIGPDGAPTVWVLHGILGSARNWRAFTRRLAKERPDLAFRLIDLRHHGDSHGALPPPDTVASCVEDLLRLADHLDEAPVAVVGHSFGGKVALMHAGRQPAGLEQTWVLDATPGRVHDLPADNGVLQVIAALHRIPMPVASHDDVAQALRDMGFSELLSRWMTTNLRPAGDRDGYVWRFDLQGVEALIGDYARVDGWPVLEDPPVTIHLVRAEKGDRWSQEDVRRIAAAPVVDHLLADSGHWVHVDSPVALRALLASHLPS